MECQAVECRKSLPQKLHGREAQLKQPSFHAGRGPALVWCLDRRLCRRLSWQLTARRMKDRRSKMDTPLRGADRRRSRRVVATVAVEVSWNTGGRFHITAVARTAVFNAHGALLRMRSFLPIPSEVELSRPGIDQPIRARVLDVGKFAPGVPTDVIVELSTPHETFWGIKTPITISREK